MFKKYSRFPQQGRQKAKSVRCEREQQNEVESRRVTHAMLCPGMPHAALVALIDRQQQLLDARGGVAELTNAEREALVVNLVWFVVFAVGLLWWLL
jgi:hypothetical protein